MFECQGLKKEIQLGLPVPKVIGIFEYTQPYGQIDSLIFLVKGFEYCNILVPGKIAP
jgi:hypothetical protein